MAIFNQITIATSGSEGWGDTFLENARAVPYFYAPYEGSFLYANSGDFYQPFSITSAGGAGNEAVALYNVDEDPQTFFDGQFAYPFGDDTGRVILDFPRLDQNPQLTPSSDNYPYTPGGGNVLSTNVAEHTALPSVHLKMTIQPVRFKSSGDSLHTAETTEASINNLEAEYSPFYVEMIGTSNAPQGQAVRASNYVENAVINNETLATDIHVYQWEQFKMSAGGNNSDYNLENAPTSVETQFPSGFRDIYFEASNPSIDGNPGILPYTDVYGSLGHTYPDEMVQIGAATANSSLTIANTLFRNKLITSLGHLPPIYGEHFTVDGDDEFVSGGLINWTNNGNSINVDDIIDIYDSYYPNGFEFDGDEEEFYSRVLHAPVNYFGVPVSPQEPNDIPSRIVLNFRTNLGANDNAPDLTQFKELNSDPNGDPNMYKTLWTAYAICEVIHYERAYRRLRVKVLHTCKHVYTTSQGNDTSDRVLFGTSINNILNTRILLDVPVPNIGGNYYFYNICQFSLMVSHLGDYSVDEKHFRQAYCAGGYVKTHRYNPSNGNLNNNQQLNSQVLNPVIYPGAGGGFGFSPTYFSYSEVGNLNYVKDRDAFFGISNPPFNTINLVDYDACLVPYTIKYNPQRFGLVYDLKENRFELQIPHIPPCIIKGTYQVF